VTPRQVEDAIRGAAALVAAMATQNRDDAEALASPGPSWALAIWLARSLDDPAGFAAAIIADSIQFEAGQAA
jgi:hypothetical protein